MSKTVWIELTRNEANALMVMLDSEIENTHVSIRDWETLDLEAYKLLAFHKFKTWYERNCNE